MGRLALRLAKAEALPYWSFVVETWPCRMSFCCTPTGAPVSSSQARYVWRKRVKPDPWCGRRDLNPHGPFKPCGFSYRLRLSPPERDALGELTPGLRSGLSLHPPPKGSGA